MEDFVEKSYKRQSVGFDDNGKNGTRHEHAMTWFNKNTIDYWRHERMYNLLDPILEIDNTATWLTVGDGRFGGDAKYIFDHGSKVLATDLTEVLLKEAVEMGYIENYKVENAENLSFDDSAFDYVFCKEAYHHFPRPYIALYEMLRVAKKGVVLIEPNDDVCAKTIRSMIHSFKGIIKHYLGKDKNIRILKGSYEEGNANYIYSISKKEIEKLSLALDYKYVVFKGLNDHYIQGGEYENINENGGVIQNEIKKRIRRRNLFCKLQVVDYGLLCTIILKTEPSQELLSELQKSGYEINKLSKNPYI
jgi:ubiquinone/menaquinone biosynthesis C-methylase UbiE